MNKSFKVQWKTGNDDELSTKLFVRDLDGPFRQIKKRIVLNDDDFTDVECFDLAAFNGRKNLLAHILSKLLPKPRNVQSLVAWYFSIELASQLLSTSILVIERMFPPKAEGCAEFREDEIRAFFQAGDDLDRFVSSGVIESFLAGERENNLSEFDLVRKQLQAIVTIYLGKELSFQSEFVESMSRGIGCIDDSRLDDHVHWVRSNPNVSVQEWHHYFANLRNAPLELFQPTAPYRKPTRHENAILNKLTRKNHVLKGYTVATLPEAAFTYLAALMRAGFFEKVSGIPENEIDDYVFHREREQQIYFMTSDSDSDSEAEPESESDLDLSFTVLNDMSLFVYSSEGQIVAPFTRDFLVEHVLTRDPSTIRKCEKELLDYFGLPPA
jgi:hypothetical protein